MPKALEYRDVVSRVKAVRPGIEIKKRRGKGSHHMIYDPDIPAHYPLPHGGNDKRRIPAGILKELIRRLDLPPDIFD